MKVALIENYFPDFLISRKNFIDYLGEKYNVTSYVPSHKDIAKVDLKSYSIKTYELNRSNKGLIQSLRLFFFFFHDFKKEKYELVHTYRLHPNIIATLAARMAGVDKIINHVTGLGVVFSSDSLKNRLLQFVTYAIYQFVFLFSNKVIFQNLDDLNLFSKKLFFVSKKFCLVESSGVNIDKFRHQNCLHEELSLLKTELDVENKNVVLCVSRLIPQKGILELYEAAKKFNDNIQFFWVGSVDVDNPSVVDQLNDTSNFTFLGKRSDIRNLLAIADIFILPTYYREGIPRAILEAMSMSIPIITTKTPGCDQTVLNGANGFLIPPRSTNAIENSISQLFTLDRVSMGRKSREIVAQRFSSEVVFKKIKSHY